MSETVYLHVDFGYDENDAIKRLMLDFREMVNFCIEKAVKNKITSFVRLWHLVKEEIKQKWDYACHIRLEAVRMFNFEIMEEEM